MIFLRQSALVRLYNPCDHAPAQIFPLAELAATVSALSVELLPLLKAAARSRTSLVAENLSLRGLAEIDNMNDNQPLIA